MMVVMMIGANRDGDDGNLKTTEHFFTPTGMSEHLTHIAAGTPLYMTEKLNEHDLFADIVTITLHGSLGSHSCRIFLIIIYVLQRFCPSCGSRLLCSAPADLPLGVPDRILTDHSEFLDVVLD